MKRSFWFFMLPIIISVIFVLILTGQNLASDQRIAAAPLSYDSSRYSETEWVKIGRDAVRSFGMVDNPESESWALMTKGSYFTLEGGGGTSENRESPVFIYQAFGNVPVFMMIGGLDAPFTDIGGMTLTFDGQNGMFTSWRLYPKEIMAQREVGLDLSFIPADSGPDGSLLPVPTLAQ